MALRLPVYLDHHATTPVDPRVVTAMLPYFTEVFGNAASRNHVFGWHAAEAVDAARAAVARLIGAEPREVIFTSGGTESNNLAIKGAAEVYGTRGRRHVITQATEHRSVLDPIERLTQAGYDATVLGVDNRGRVDPAAVRRAVRTETFLVSVMLANNEVGTIQPLAEIGAATRELGVLLHCDATQALGKVPIDVDALGVDLLSLSAHKIHGPKGVGALYVRRRRPPVRLAPLLDGGGHERGMRSGTVNVPGVVGFGRAAQLCATEGPEENARVATLRDRLHRAIAGRLEGVALNGHPIDRLGNNLNLSFAGIEAEALARAMPDVAVSTGAACSSAAVEPSHVLRALGVPDDLAHASIRFGLGRFTTEEEIDFAADLVVRSVGSMRCRCADSAEPQPRR